MDIVDTLPVIKNCHLAVCNDSSFRHISAALGIRIGKNFKGEKEDFVIAVIGDGALTSGEAWEGLNNAGQLRPDRFIVILNDNEMSISPNVGAISNYLNKIYSGKIIQDFRQKIKTRIS